MKKKFTYQIEVIDDVYFNLPSRLNPFPEDTHAKEVLARIFQDEIVKMSSQKCDIAAKITADNRDGLMRKIDHLSVRINQVKKIQRSVKLVKTEEI